MLKKIEQYYVNTFKKFGWIIPSVIVGVAFAIAITLPMVVCLNA